jgi:hypothetical protein
VKDLILLGYWPEYLAVEQAMTLPANTLSSYQAVITWFQTPALDQAEAYCDWLSTQIREGRKVMIFGNFGAFGKAQTDAGTGQKTLAENPRLNEFFKNFGIEYQGNWIGDPNILVPHEKVPEMVEQEAKFKPADFRHYYYWKSVNPENKLFLTVSRKDQPESESAFIARTPFGGFAFEGYIYKSVPKTPQVSFFLNRTAFLKECLEYKSPRPAKASN